jgi:hypothetical protein
MIVTVAQHVFASVEVYRVLLLWRVLAFALLLELVLTVTESADVILTCCTDVPATGAATFTDSESDQGDTGEDWFGGVQDIDDDVAAFESEKSSCSSSAAHNQYTGTQRAALFTK